MNVPMAFLFKIYSVDGGESWHLSSLGEIIAFCYVSSLGQWRTLYISFTQGPKMLESEPTRTISHCHDREQKQACISPKVIHIISADISLAETSHGTQIQVDERVKSMSPVDMTLLSNSTSDCVPPVP